MANGGKVLLSGRTLVLEVASHMARIGFMRVKRSRNGSIYMRLPPYPFRIRLSDHEWSGESRAIHLHVIRNAVLQPILSGDLPAFAQHQKERYIERCLERIGAAA
jgi:hypothetical protein